MDSEARSVRSWRNKARGTALEQDIICQADLAHDIVLIQQHPETKFYGGGRAKVVGHAWPDFVAISYGHPYIFDAKSTNNKEAVSMPANRIHQFTYMKMAANAGATCFYLVYWQQDDQHTAYVVNDKSEWPFRCRFDEADVWTEDFDYLKTIMDCLHGT